MYQYKAFVTRVIDGDTFYAHVDLGFDIFIDKLFRLDGVNTPESRSRDLKEKEKGLRAKEFVRSLIEKKEVKIDSVKTEKYGRYLAVVHIDATTLNDILLKEGYAKVYHGEKRE